MGPSPKHWDRRCVQPKEVSSAGVCRQPEGGKELLPGFPWGPDSKINCFEGHNGTSPWRAQGSVHGSRRRGQEAEPTYLNTHLPPGRAAGERTPGLAQTPTPVMGGPFLGLAGTPSASQLAQLRGLGLSPPESLLSPQGSVTRPAEI